MIMVVMIATSFGISEVNAASGLPKISSLRASAQKASVSISWKKLTKKQQKKVKGIAIYRDGEQIKLISKKSRSFTDSGLKAGTSYSYTVKTYKNTKKKEWFNKKTQKWQKKKPAKQYRGKSRKAKKYSTGVTISVTTESTAPATAPSVDSTITESKDPDFLNSYLPVAATYDLSEGSHTFSVKSKSGVTWSSNNTSVAKPATGIDGVANPGKIYFISAGTATLTVTSKASGEAKTIRLTITDNNSGGSSGENPSTFKEFKVTEYPSTVDTKTANYSIKVQLPADNFGITWVSADDNCIQINGSASTDSQNISTQNIIAKKKYGNLTLLGTLTVPSGVNYTGNKTVKVVITNTVYPRNADGSYTLTSNGQYWWCGGVKVRIDDLFNILPNNTTFKVNIPDINNGIL